jgi:hypothetical protein
VKEQLDEIALAVELAVDASLLGSVLARRNDSLDLAEFQLLQNGVRVVAAVAEASFACDEVDELVCDSAVVLLAWRDDDLERPALQIDDGVNLRRETASRTADFVFFTPPRPPAAS